VKHATLRRHLAVLLLGATLTAPAAWAVGARAGRTVDRAGAKPKILVVQLWQWFTSLWDEEGSAIDPFG
jgi:hypothetical protein